MNANELAQEFEEYLKSIEELPWGKVLCDLAVTKLRQQQESIEGLNRDYDLLFAEHQLLLKQEPVAWEQFYPDIGKPQIEQPKVRTGDCLLVGVCASEGHKIQKAQPEQEPVAIRYDYDGYGYQYIDSGSGSDWQTRVRGEPLYTTSKIEVGCAECGVNGGHALYCVACAERYLKEKNT